MGGVYTFLFINPQHDNNLVPSNTDKLLDGPDTSPGQLGEQDHAVDVVVLEELDVGAHLGDLVFAYRESPPPVWREEGGLTCFTLTMT